MKLSDIKAKILMIDDDSDVRNAVRLTLDSELEINHTFTEADNVGSGLKALKTIMPDIVILDLHMPGKDGFDFLDDIRKNESFPLTKVIILTADDRLKNLLHTENKGIDAYHFMGKPFANDALKAMVLSLIVP